MKRDVLDIALRDESNNKKHCRINFRNNENGLKIMIGGKYVVIQEPDEQYDRKHQEKPKYNYRKNIFENYIPEFKLVLECPKLPIIDHNRLLRCKIAPFKSHFD